jgi:hypothetical protein
MLATQTHTDLIVGVAYIFQLHIAEEAFTCHGGVSRLRRCQGYKGKGIFFSSLNHFYLYASELGSLFFSESPNGTLVEFSST